MQQPIAPTLMTPPAIEDLQPVQAKMAVAISLLYEAVAEAARLELSAETLQNLLALIEAIQKNRDELLKECTRSEPVTKAPNALRRVHPDWSVLGYGVPVMGRDGLIAGDDIRAAFLK